MSLGNHEEGETVVTPWADTTAERINSIQVGCPCAIQLFVVVHYLNRHAMSRPARASIGMEMASTCIQLVVATSASAELLP